MRLAHTATLLEPRDTPAPVTAVSWSPDARRLAVAMPTDNSIALFDENGTRKDRFATKPADPSTPAAYRINACLFSPDSSRLAIAQSDGAVFVYKLGLQWGDKKSICNKFLPLPPVTALAWPSQVPNAFLFGAQDGKV